MTMYIILLYNSHQIRVCLKDVHCVEKILTNPQDVSFLRDLPSIEIPACTFSKN
jgi:hypothetical protein